MKTKLISFTRLFALCIALAFVLGLNTTRAQVSSGMTLVGQGDGHNPPGAVPEPPSLAQGIRGAGPDHPSRLSLASESQRACAKRSDPRSAWFLSVLARSPRV